MVEMVGIENRVKSEFAAIETPENAGALCSILDDLANILTLLKDSDALLKAAVLRSEGKVYTVPQGGSTELGLVLYWMKNKPSILEDLLRKLPSWLADAITYALNAIVDVCPPTITPADITYLEDQSKAGHGVIASDGTVLGTNTYEDLDIGWATALIAYFYSKYASGLADFLPSPSAKPTPIPMTAINGGDTIKIAIVGDWGAGAVTGDYDPAPLVMQAVAKMDADYIIHLGDVYYHGSSKEEQQYLVDMWPSMPAGRSFTLNSNHEMYDGAKAYFDIGLGRAGGATPFDAQEGMSFFALTYNDWAFVGLDSGYYDDSFWYMKGGWDRQDSKQPNPQPAFLKEIAKTYKNVVTMSHHTGVSTDGTLANPMLDAVNGCFKGNASLSKHPVYWYWGHIHSGIVYGDNTPAGDIKGRCVGHSSIPIGDAWGLESGTNVIEWYSSTPIKDAGNPAYANRVQNGFAVLTLSPTGLTEEFYGADINGNPVKQYPFKSNLE